MGKFSRSKFNKWMEWYEEMKEQERAVKLLAKQKEKEVGKAKAAAAEAQKDALAKQAKAHAAAAEAAAAEARAALDAALAEQEKAHQAALSARLREASTKHEDELVKAEAHKCDAKKMDISKPKPAGSPPSDFQKYGSTGAETVCEAVMETVMIVA